MLDMNLNQMEFINNCSNEYTDCRICIVISHSCDIARKSKIEPNIEILPCHLTGSLEGVFLKGSNCRKLNFQLTINNKMKYYYINACEKISISKDKLGVIKIIEFDSCGLELSFFQNWLASRYRRQTLPDDLNKKIDKLKLNKELKKVSEELLSIFVEKEQISDNNISYTLIFVSDYNMPNATEIIDSLESKLVEKLNNLPKDHIKLFIQHISSIDLNYHMLTNYSKYDCDYLCVDNDLPTINK
jgi:hypothetical protein